MWARVVEFMIACWLAISPFIFAYPSDATFFWTTDFVCSAAIAFFSLLSFYEPLRKLHLLNLAVAFYLIALGFILQQSPIVQNYVVLGIIFLMLAVIPTDAEMPPKPWRDFYQK